MATENEAVGLLGGSFDPVHRGHISIAKSFLQSSCISKLWILLTPESPHKKDQELTEYSSRMKMLQLSFKGIEGITITDLENRLSAPYYTVRTLRYLTNHYPGKSFFWCIGEDSLINFESWYRWEEILDLCNLLVALRPSSERSSLNSRIIENTHFVDHNPVDISSTRIRALAHESKNLTDFVLPSVASYIEQHKLYQS